MTDRKINDAKERKQIRHLIDVHVGYRIRLRRRNLGLSPVDLAKVLGVKYQQLQFYEVGRNQVSSKALYILSNILCVPISFFFDELPDAVSKHAVYINNKLDNSDDSIRIFSVENRKDIEREIYALAAVFYKIQDQATRKSIIEFLKVLGQLPSNNL